VQVRYRLHRKMILEAIERLQRGTSLQKNLWEYIHDDPTKAALYASGVLCTPRLTMLWLYAFEYHSTLGWLLADADGSQAARVSEDGSKPRDVSEPGLLQSLMQHYLPAPLRTNTLLFWLGWVLWPALLVGIVHCCLNIETLCEH
jgi:hypothetical protein